MTADRSNFVIGVCTRLRDASAFVEARAACVDGELQDVSASSKSQYPPDGEIELRGGRSVVRINDWALVRPAMDGPPGRRKYVASSSKRLFPFEDLSTLYAPETARRLLVETGKQDGFEGEKIFRIGKSEVVGLTMARGEDGRFRAGSGSMSKLPVFAFDDARHYKIPTSFGSLELYEKESSAAQVGTTNWSTDIDFLAQVIAASATEDHTSGDFQLVAYLRTRAMEIEQRLSEAQLLDPKIGQEIIRSRQIADLLRTRADLISEFLSVLRSDPDIRSRLEAQIAALAQAEVDTQKQRISDELSEAITLEFADKRRQKTSELEQTFRELETSMLTDLQRKIDHRERDELANLNARRNEMEGAVAMLEARRDALSIENDEKEDVVNVLSSQAGSLTEEIQQRGQEIDRLLKIQKLIDGVQRPPEQAVGAVPFLAEIKAAPALGMDSAADWIRDCPLLSPRGRQVFGQFVSYLLSGGIPVVVGTQSDDFLDIAARMITGGDIVVFDCDPTIITFDDLWSRPGSGAPTILGRALADVRDNGTARFCILRKAELSAAQFWIDALTQKARRGELPANLFVAVVVSDPNSEAAERILTRRPQFSADSAIDVAAAAKVLMLEGPSSINRRIDTTRMLMEPTKTGVLIARSLAEQTPVRTSDAGWLARLHGFSSALLGNDAEAFMRDIISKIGASLDGDLDGKQGLKIVETRGPSNA